MRLITLVAVIFIPIFLVFSSYASENKESDSELPMVSVLCSSSLTKVMNSAVKEFIENNRATVFVSYSTPTQIKEIIIDGSDPAELYISEQLDRSMAEPDYPDWEMLRNMGTLDTNTITNITGNSLVIIGSKDVNYSSDQTIEEILKSQPVIYMTDPTSEPGGKYIKHALEKMGIWNNIEPNIVRLDSSQMALRIIAGEGGDASSGKRVGIVYKSDLRIEPDVNLLAEIPQKFYPPITYKAAVVADRNQENMQMARSFLDFLKSKKASKIFESNGFLPN